MNIFGSSVSSTSSLSPRRAFLYHWIFCYYGYEEDTFDDRKVSFITAWVKLGFFAIWALLWSVIAFLHEKHLRAWCITQLVTISILLVSYTIVSNRMQIMKWLYPSPSTSKPGSINRLRIIILLLITVSTGILWASNIWGIFIAFFLHNLPWIWWICFSVSLLGGIFAITTCIYYVKKLYHFEI